MKFRTAVPLVIAAWSVTASPLDVLGAPPETTPPSSAPPETTQPETTPPSSAPPETTLAPDTTVPTSTSLPARPLFSAPRWEKIFAPGVSTMAIVSSADRSVFGGDLASLYPLVNDTLKRTGGDVNATLDRLLRSAGVDDEAAPGAAEEWETRVELALTAGTPPVLPPNRSEAPFVRSIAFPVLGPTSFYNDWQVCRDGCTRFHEGTDLIGPKGQPLRAAVDGVVTRIRIGSGTISGSFIEITDTDGWRYVYRHLNNDTPGTNDGQGDDGWAVPDGIEVGTFVRAGQVVGFMGNSGNAEQSVPHLHFEIRTPEGFSVNPYPSIIEAQQREQGMVGIGAWSTLYPEVGERTVPYADTLPYPVFATLVQHGGGLWASNDDGSVVAFGEGQLVAPFKGASVPAEPAGSGLNPAAIPSDWIEPDLSLEREHLRLIR